MNFSLPDTRPIPNYRPQALIVAAILLKDLPSEEPARGEYLKRVEKNALAVRNLARQVEGWLQES